MQRMELILVRHGTTATNKQGRYAGRGDHPITPEFAQEMRGMVAAHPYPAVQHVYRSPAVRCRETAAIAFPDVPETLLEDLWEFDFGVADGMIVAEARKLVEGRFNGPQDAAFHYPGGETMGAFTKRVLGAVDEVVADAAAQGFARVAVVTHVMVLDAALRALARPPIADEERLCPNGMGLAVSLAPAEWPQAKQLRFEALLPHGAPRASFLDTPYYRRGW